MASSSVSLSSLKFSRLHHPQFLASPHPPIQLHLLRTFPTFQVSRRTSTQENDEFMNDSRNWSRFNFDGYEIDEDDEDEDDDEQEDRSLDLLIRFVENIFRKVSKRARKAVRAVLPYAISTKLVICTLGSVVFVSILLIRGVWSGVLYLQEGRTRYTNGINDDDQPAWNRAQPVT